MPPAERLGGLVRIDQLTRLSPRRFEVGISSTTLPVGIEDLELHPADHMPRLLIISDRRAARRIVAEVGGVAFGPAAIALDPLLDGTAGHQRSSARERCRT